MKNKVILIALTASAILAGCVVAPAGRPYYGEPVMVAPPPPRVEYAPAPPAAGYVWIDGFWNWGGQRHEWVPGHWSAPRPGYSWVPHRWEQNGDRWRQHEGHWEEERGHRDHHDRDHDRQDRRDWR